MRRLPVESDVRPRGGMHMCETKTPQQARENITAINQAVESYQRGDMSADEAGAVIYDRLFGELRLSHPQQQ